MTHPGPTAQRSSRVLPVCLIALCTLMPASLVMAEIYKWTGDDGKINYSQMPPPPGVHSEQIKQRNLPPAPPAATENPVVKQQARLEKEKKDKEVDALTAEQEKKNAEIRRLNCDAATRNLAALETESQRNFISDKGEYLRPTDEERKKLIDKTKKQIEKYCTD